MKAFVMKEIGHVGFLEKEICTSDSHTPRGGIGPRENLTLGHEAVGVVDSVGSEVMELQSGDRVAALEPGEAPRRVHHARGLDPLHPRTSKGAMFR
jgi:threonine dehydrogenase-like Zn-dependent dehydrogenase